MSGKTVSEIAPSINNLKIETAVIHPLINNDSTEDCETAEEAVTTDSEDYLSEPLR